MDNGISENGDGTNWGKGTLSKTCALGKGARYNNGWRRPNQKKGVNSVHVHRSKNWKVLTDHPK